MKRCAIVVLALTLMLLCGCETEEISAFFRYYENGKCEKIVDIPSGYVLDVYDAGKTESGFDITFHFRRDDNAD